VLSADNTMLSSDKLSSFFLENLTHSLYSISLCRKQLGTTSEIYLTYLDLYLIRIIFKMNPVKVFGRLLYVRGCRIVDTKCTFSEFRSMPFRLYVEVLADHLCKVHGSSRPAIYFVHDLAPHPGMTLILVLIWVPG
jgi:hypothetical protein